ncbi:hypothetical protein NDU88_001088 [Pleurodeles waltl]|uniref:Uncharacterized protein n=1 Tax=Pleurodeles waltl TaxID=8319 RepID=A0AAV7V8I7_PLEWA|nr:hypothetical protein NDU88_001088 [Pleurodeles waltl]
MMSVNWWCTGACDTSLDLCPNDQFITLADAMETFNLGTGPFLYFAKIVLRACGYGLQFLCSTGLSDVGNGAGYGWGLETDLAYVQGTAEGAPIAYGGSLPTTSDEAINGEQEEDRVEVIVAAQTRAGDPLPTALVCILLMELSQERRVEQQHDASKVQKDWRRVVLSSSCSGFSVSRMESIAHHSSALSQQDPVGTLPPGR